MSRLVRGRISLALIALAAWSGTATPGPVDFTPPVVTMREATLPCVVWVVRNALESPASWARALAAVERAGCDRMYLQVSGRWDALYPSHVFVPPATPPRGWEDPLAEALAQAHAQIEHRVEMQLVKQ